MPSANPSLPQTDVYAQGGQYYPPAQPSYQRLRPNQRYVTLPQSQVQQHPQHQEYTQVAPVQSMQQHFMAARHEETYQSPTMEPMIFAYQQQNQNSFANEDSLTIGVDIALTKNLTNQTSEMKLPSQSHHHVTENLSSQPTDPEPPKFADTNKCSSTDNCFVPPTYHDFASVEVPNPLPDMSPANQPGITSAQSDILDESQWNDDGWACDQPEENGGPVVTYFGGNDLVAHLSASEEVSVAATEENSAASREEMEAGSERHYLGMGGAPDVVSDSQYAADSCDYYQEREVDEMPNFGQPIVDHSNLGQPQSNSGNPPDLWQAYQTGSTADSDVANGNIYASGYPPPDIVEKQMDEEAHRPAARQSSENQNWSMEDVVLDDSNGPASESLLEQSEQQPSLVQHFTSAVGQRIQGIASVFTQGSSSSVDHCEADEHIEPRHVRSESQTLQETAGEAPQLSFGYRSAQETIRPPVIPFNGNSQVNFRSLTPSSSSPFVQPVMPVPQTNPPASAARSTKRPANLSVSEIQSYSYFEEQLDLVNQQNDPTVPDRVNLWRSEAAETENRQSDQNQNFAPSEHPLPPSNLSVCSRDRLSQDRSDLDATPLEMRDVDWNSLNQQLRSYALSSEQIPEVEIPPQ